MSQMSSDPRFWQHRTLHPKAEEIPATDDHLADIEMRLRRIHHQVYKLAVRVADSHKQLEQIIERLNFETLKMNEAPAMPPKKRFSASV